MRLIGKETAQNIYQSYLKENSYSPLFRNNTCKLLFYFITVTSKCVNYMYVRLWVYTIYISTETRLICAFHIEFNHIKKLNYWSNLIISLLKRMYLPSNLNSVNILILIHKMIILKHIPPPCVIFKVFFFFRRIIQEK